MKDISAKSETHREAIAEAILSLPDAALALLRDRRLEKGDALEIARMAGILAAKRTPELIPFCHGIPIAQAEVRYSFEPGRVRVIATVQAIAATGVEMEALTGASLAALTLYDMLKPHTTELAIEGVRLVQKTGGKSDFQERLDPPGRVAVLTLESAKDRAGAAVVEALGRMPGVEVRATSRIKGSPDALRAEVTRLVESRTDVILTVGGTGLAGDDFAVETLRPMIVRDLPGVMEAARSYGQRRTPYAMLSRGVAGLIGRTLVVTLPGSTRGAAESCAALFPALLHIVAGQRRSRHRGRSP